MKRLNSLVFLATLVTISIIPSVGNTADTILSKEEILWLESRNNTIVVYPEKNFPPYSYQNSAGTPQGLSIDYIELIAEKIGANISYLPARSRSQILDDVKQVKKGDVITSLTDTKEREDILYFTDTYVSSPAVIVIRKDLDKGDTLTISDLTGKKIAIGKDYAVEEFIRTNNPRVVIESVVDDESGLQQVVLGEVDAAIMDITSLSYYLSKQVLNSVKVVGSTGFEYKLAFAVPKDKEILQSILDKGLSQISTNDRKILVDKWVIMPNEIKEENPLALYAQSNLDTIILYVLIVIVIILLLKKKSRNFLLNRKRKVDVVNELKEELQDIEILEEDIKEKIKNIDL